MPTKNKSMDKKREHKMKISVSISRYLKEKLDKLVENGEFSNISEVINIAVTRFLVEYEKEKKIE